MEKNSLTQLVKEIEDAYWDASFEVGQAREAECEDIAESALMGDDDASHAMNRLNDRIEDLKRMVNAPDFADAKDFEPKKAYLEITEPLEDFVDVLADQLSAEAPRGGLTRGQEKTVTEYPGYMGVLRRDIAVNLRNMTASCVRRAVKEHKSFFTSEAEAESFAAALIDMTDTGTAPKCPWPRLFEAVQLTAEVLTYLTEKCGYLILRQCEDNSSDYDYWVDVFYSIRKPDSGKSEQQPEEAHLYMYQTKDFTLTNKWRENGDEQYISVKEMAVHCCDETDFGLILRRIICMPSYETDVPEELKKRVTDVLAGIPDDYVCR